MSEIYRTTVFEKVQISITTLTQQKLTEMEDKLILCLKQKLSKLASLLRNPSLTLYCQDGHILVHDKYMILNSFTEIAEAFGMDVKSVKCALRGECYVVSDKIIELLKQMQSSFELSGILTELELNLPTTLNAQLVDQLREILEQNKFEYSDIRSKYGELIAEASRSLRNTNSFNIEGLREIEQTRDRYSDRDILLSSREVGVSSDKVNVKQRLKEFVSDVDANLKANNSHMQNGVTEMLYHRAKQLGYSVEKQKKGDTIQLVMVGLQ